MKKYRWGFVGSGGISHRAVRDIAQLERAEVYAIASRQQASADVFAQKYGLKKAYADFEMLCKDPQVDIIYIGTPHIYHKEQTLLALSHGKAVLCEKPLSVSVRDTQAMIQEAKIRKVFFMEALWTRFLPVMQQVKGWIHAGEIGEVISAKASFCSKAKFDSESRIFFKKLGGGALLDLGVYPVSVLCYLLAGPIKKISARGSIGTTQVDEEAEIILEFDSGAVATAACSIIRSAGESLTLEGTLGTVEVPFFWRATEAFLFCDNQLVKEAHGKESFEFEALEVMKALDEGRLESPVMPWNESLRVAQILEESRCQVESPPRENF